MCNDLAIKHQNVYSLHEFWQTVTHTIKLTTQNCFEKSRNSKKNKYLNVDETYYLKA